MIRPVAIITMIFIAGCHVPQSLRKSEWTIPEVKEWVTKYSTLPGSKGLLLYQGSDTGSHYFISRVYDEWTWFRLKRSDLNLIDLRNHNISSSATLGYYYVDPNKDFIKVKDY